MVATEREGHAEPRSKINREREGKEENAGKLGREKQREESKRGPSARSLVTNCLVFHRVHFVHVANTYTRCIVPHSKSSQGPQPGSPFSLSLSLSLSFSLFVRVPRARPTCKSCGDIWFTYVIRVAVPWVFPSPGTFQLPRWNWANHCRSSFRGSSTPPLPTRWPRNRTDRLTPMGVCSPRRACSRFTFIFPFSSNYSESLPRRSNDRALNRIERATFDAGTILEKVVSRKFFASSVIYKDFNRLRKIGRCVSATLWTLEFRSFCATTRPRW